MFETMLNIGIFIMFVLDLVEVSKLNYRVKKIKVRHTELEKLSIENKKLKETNLEQAQTIERQKIYHRKNLKLEEENRKLKEELEGGEEDEENDNYRIDGISVGNGRV